MEAVNAAAGAAEEKQGKKEHWLERGAVMAAGVELRQLSMAWGAAA